MSTEADYLRQLGRDIHGSQWGYNKNVAVNWTLNRIADLLDAVPPEVLKALADKTWRAVPVRELDVLKLVEKSARVAASRNYDAAGLTTLDAALIAAQEKSE